MPRTRKQLEQAAAEAEAWLDHLDPATLVTDDISDLRAITAAVAGVAESEARLVAAVQVARDRGRSWAWIGQALGVSKQAAMARYSDQITAR